jgi:putative FmdB family regulatory protein
VPLYEYRCRSCDTVFEARRPMSDASAPAECPDGHVDSVRLLSVFAATGRSAASGGSSTPMPMPSGGGCGGACACH